MERTNNYRLLEIKQILFDETDDDHELGINELRDKLQIIMGGSPFDNRTVKQDLEILDQTGFEIVRNQGKFGKILYSHQARTFEVYQLRLIVDAILSARFITTNEKNQLIDKIKRLTSKRIAETLPESIVFSQSTNMDYKLVKLNIDRVHRAVTRRKVLTYQYGKFNVDKEFEFSRNGDLYELEPYALIWQNDYYYLIGRFLQTDEMRHYRLDRMRHVELSEKSFKKGSFQLQEYVDQSFHMFAGEEIRIKVRFHESLINVVFDRFGLEADIKKEAEDYFVLTTKAKLSDGLVNWILTWGNKAKVLSPSELVDRVKEKIKQMNDIYQS